MQDYINRAPGVYRQDIYPSGPIEFRTGVPAFLGFTNAGEDNVNKPLPLTRWPQLEDYFGHPLRDGFLARAVRGFFENGGSLCYVVALDDPHNPAEAFPKGLEALEHIDAIDLVCAPDIMLDLSRAIQRKQPLSDHRQQAIRHQQLLLDHCDKMGDRFSILDALPMIRQANTADDNRLNVSDQRNDLRGKNGAMYHPWIGIRSTSENFGLGVNYLPPCGHIAGIYARTDADAGVHKAPANQIIAGVVDLQARINDPQQSRLNPAGINCLRAFPGRGIRVWGARTLSTEPAWTYVNVRRLFLTAGRWIERNMTGELFESNTPNLWARITRDLNAYFNDLFQKGALKGATAREAFYVKCDSETNPQQVRDAGKVISEIGLAPNRPNEFVIVRIVHGVNGVTIAGPQGPA